MFKDILRSLFGSKKFVALVAGLITAGVAKLGWDAPPEFIIGILGLVGTYIIGQGIADNGKEAAKITAQTTEDQMARLEALRDAEWPTGSAIPDAFDLPAETKAPEENDG